MNQRLVLRPSRLSDLPAVERIAAASAIGIGSLPADREQLHNKIRLSTQALDMDTDHSGEENYFFVLEQVDTGQIVGTSGIAASAGFGDRFYSYRNEFIVHAAAELGVANKIHSLHLCHDLTGTSLLTSFYIDPDWAGSAWPQLLSRGRLLFMADQSRRFAGRLVAESVGVCDEAGRSPFWEAVGQRFFNIDYAQAERRAGGRSKRFIAELMPQYPIYVPLLPPEAQLAIGQLHPAAELPFQILMDEGFEADTYVDVFDAGPTVDAQFGSLLSVRHSRKVKASRVSEVLPGGAPHLVANTTAANFRATIVDLPVAAERGSAPLTATQLELLEVGHGDELRVVALNHASR
ncbi:MAG: arginine N-succinyltransferase [Rhodoferax sp.]|nr:arginine N-succinyltransferase [Rhodoferax sp.]